MLPKKSRLSTKDIPAVLKGSALHTPLFTLRFRKALNIGGRFAVVVSKKTEKTAVGRNRMRRRLYEALRAIKTKPEIEGAIFLKKESVQTPFSQLVALLKDTLGKIK